MNKIKAFFIKLLMPKKLTDWINGRKTAIGLILMVSAMIASANGFDVPDEAYGLIAAVLGVGFKHKLEKAEQAGKEAKEIIEKALTLVEKKTE